MGLIRGEMNMAKIDTTGLPPEDQVRVRAKLKKLDDTTLPPGYNVGAVVPKLWSSEHTTPFKHIGTSTYKRF